MSDSRDDDLLEGDFGRRKARRATSGVAKVRGVSAAGSKRARAAWFNRTRGARNVKLAPERPPGSQRVIVKLKPVVHATAAARGRGAGSLMRHALYVERDGAGRDGDPVQVFDRQLDRANGGAFVERCKGDRHHFQVILSPEHGGELEDLKAYTRELVDRVERDLNTHIDWIAAEHHDTGRPHVHLLIRGRREDGRDLVIPRPYVSHGFRHRAEELATEQLGPRLEPERPLDRRAERAVRLERPTHLDRELLGHAHDGHVAVRDLPDTPHMRGPLVQRLNRLEDWGLASRDEAGTWRLDPELERKLSRLGEARDRERATARLLAREDRGLEPARLRELEAAHSSQRMSGRLVGFEQMGDDARGPYLVGVEGIDGKLWTARVARLEDLRPLNGIEHGAIVGIERAQSDIMPSDRTIWEIARENALAYSASIHREMRPTDRDNYIQMHERRLEALRRDGIVTRERDGTFVLPEDYPVRVAARAGLGGRESARVILLDPQPLHRQVRHEGPTWLDRLADGVEDRSQLRCEGFGEEARQAWKQRETTLKALGLGETRAEGFYPAPGWRDQLAKMEHDALRERVERDTGRVPHFARDGERVSGLYTSRIHTAERGYALIEHGRTATLAPWRPEMDRALNQFVSGRVNGRQFDFKYGREVEKAVMRMLGLDR